MDASVSQARGIRSGEGHWNTDSSGLASTPASNPTSKSSVPSHIGINNGLDVCTGALRLFLNGPRSLRVLRLLVTVLGSGGRMSSASSNLVCFGVGLGSRDASCIGEEESRSMTSTADLLLFPSSARSPCDWVRLAVGVGEKYDVMSLPLSARGVEKSGEGRLSLFDFLGVRWRSCSLGFVVRGAG